MLAKINKLKFLNILQKNQFSFAKNSIMEILKLIEIENSITITSFDSKLLDAIKSKILSVKKAWQNNKGGYLVNKLKSKYQSESFFFELGMCGNSKTEFKSNKKINPRLVNNFISREKKKSIFFLNRKFKYRNYYFFNRTIENDNLLASQQDMIRNELNFKNEFYKIALFKEKYFIPDCAFIEFGGIFGKNFTLKKLKAAYKQIDRIFEIKNLSGNYFYSFEAKFRFYFEKIRNTFEISDSEIETVIIIEELINNKNFESRNQTLKISFVILNDPNLKNFIVGYIKNTNESIEVILNEIEFSINNLKESMIQNGKVIRFYLMANFFFQKIFILTKKKCVWCLKNCQDTKLKNLFEWFIVKKSSLIERCFKNIFNLFINEIKILSDKKNELKSFFLDFEKKFFKIKFKKKGIKQVVVMPSKKETKIFLSNFFLDDFKECQFLLDSQQLWEAFNTICLILNKNYVTEVEKSNFINQQIVKIKNMFEKLFEKNNNQPFLHFLFDHLEKLCSPKYELLFNFFLNHKKDSFLIEKNIFLKEKKEMLLNKLNRIEYIDFMNY